MNLEAATKRHNLKIGTYLKDHREKAGLTQQQVADACDCKAQFISNWERGVCVPPMNILKRLIKLYKLSEKEFLNLMLKEQEQLLMAQLGIKSRKVS